MPRPVTTLLLLSLLTFVAGLGRQAITDSDEAFYAEAAREMVEGGDWLTPHFNYHDRWEKPALYYWLTAATYAVAGISEFSARLWSALSGIGLVLLTCSIARRIDDRPSTAWLAAAIVATSFGYFMLGRWALPDLPLTFFITLGIMAVLRAVDAASARSSPPQSASAASDGDRMAGSSWWAVAGAAIGLGFLTKGPVALIVPALVLLPIWWHERRTIRVAWAGVALALAVFVLVGLPWYAAMTATHGSTYLRSFFLGDNLQRFATDRFQSDPRPLWFYVPVVIGGLMPWSALLVALLATDVVNAIRWRWHLSEGQWRLLSWVMVPLIFYTASIGKQPRYVLPVLPPLAILLARSMTERIDRGAVSEGGEGPAFRLGTWISAAIFALLAFILARVQPVLITVPPAATWIGVAALALTALGLGYIAAARQWRSVPYAMTAAAAVLLMTIQFGALTGVRPEAVEMMADLVRANRHDTEPVGVYQAFVRNLVFYTRTRQTELYTEKDVVEFLHASGRTLLVISAEDLPQVESLVGTPLRRLGQVEYLNTANIRIGTLLFPDRAREIETVVLVSNR